MPKENREEIEKIKQKSNNLPEYAKWFPGDTSIYQIKNASSDKEKYKGWYIMIFTYRRIIKDGDIVPEVRVKLVDDLKLSEMTILRYVPNCDFGRNIHNIFIASHKIVDGNNKNIEDTFNQNNKTYAIEEISWGKGNIMQFHQYDFETVDKYVAWENIVEEVIDAYERVLDGFGIDKNISSIELIKMRIEELGVYSENDK